MRYVVIDLISISVLGTVIFAFLLCLKRGIQKRCGIKRWYTLLMCSALLFVVPLHPVKLLLTPLLAPFRSFISGYLTAEDQKYGFSYTGMFGSDAAYRLIFWLWVIGGAIYLIASTIMYVAYVSRMKNDSCHASLHINDVFANRILLNGTIRQSAALARTKLLVHDDIISPVVYGFWNKKIVFPSKTIEGFNSDEIYLMLRHEVIHILHYDMWKRLFLILLQAIQWFNPILYLLRRNLIESMEMCCDQAAIGDNADLTTRQQYSELLVSMIDNQRRRIVMGIPMANKTFITKRIAFIMKPVNKTDKLFLTALIITLCLSVMLCLCGFTVADSRSIKEKALGDADVGEPSQSVVKIRMHDEIERHNLTTDGDFVFEQQLYPEIVNYMPVDFTADSVSISLSLNSKSVEVTTYLYYATDKEYPIMQLTLDAASPEQSFSGLSSSFLYSIGLIFEGDV